MIIDEEDNPILYFCTTPNENNIIREFITCENHKKLEQSISLIFNDLRFKDIDKLEIFSPRHDALLELAKKKGADFIEFIRPNSSNMIKILNNNLESEKFNETFLLQGDNA